MEIFNIYSQLLYAQIYVQVLRLLEWRKTP
jgi:hypothetical protein